MLLKMWVKGRTLRMRSLTSMAEREVVVVVNKVLAMVSGLLGSLEILPLLLLLLLLLLRVLVLLVMVVRDDMLEILVLLARWYTHTHTHLRQRIPAMCLFHRPYLLQLHKRVSLLLPLLGRRWRVRVLRMTAIAHDR